MVVTDCRRFRRIEKEIELRREADRNNPVWKLIATMPHDGGGCEIDVPDDFDPIEAPIMPSFWRRVVHILFGR